MVDCWSLQQALLSLRKIFGFCGFEQEKTVVEVLCLAAGEEDCSSPPVEQQTGEGQALLLL